MDLKMFASFAIPGYLAWIVILVTVLYWYFTRNHGYWKKMGVPYVKPWPFVGSVILNKNKPFHISQQERYKEYGSVYGYYEGNKPILNVADPELLRDILLKDFRVFPNRRFQDFVDPVTRKMLSVMVGEDWKRIRSIVSSTFSTGKIKRVTEIFEECAKTLCNNLREVAKEGKHVNAKELYGAFTMDVIASSAFSTKLDSHNDPNNKFVQMAKKAFSGGFTWRMLLAFVAPSIMKMLGITITQPEVTNFFRSLIMQIIEERKRTAEMHNDFLQLLLDTHKDTEVETKSGNGEKDIVANYLNEGGDYQPINSSYRKKALSEDELLAQCVIFFLAGYFPTSTTLSFASYLLATQPESQEKVIAEIDQALRDNKGKLTYEAIQGMGYLDNVISETLRMYPPAVRLERVASQDFTLGNTGITIPKGMIVGCPVYALHRDPKYYPNPDKFDPDRFSNEERAKRPAYTYLPFGGGPRNCVAMRFALMELKTCLACVFSQFRVKVPQHMKGPIKFRFTPFQLHPVEVPIQLEIRNDAFQL